MKLFFQIVGFPLRLFVALLLMLWVFLCGCFNPDTLGEDGNFDLREFFCWVVAGD